MTTRNYCHDLKMRLLSIKYGTVLRLIYMILTAIIGWPVTVESNVGLIEMGKMVATSGFCFTGDLWKSYGCYCGLGSRCTRPVDCLDSCCEQHDKCYRDLEKELHPGEGYVLWLGYNWREEADDIGCDDCSKVVIDINANFTVGPRSLQSFQDLHILQSCRKCLCDKKLTMCLRGKPCPVEGKNHSAVCPSTSDVQVAEKAEKKANKNIDNEAKNKVNESNVGLIEMGKMVATSGLCFTGDLWESYGCYCGLGSRCSRLIDCLDSCCEQHDKCYGDLEKELHPNEGYVLMLEYNWREEADDIGCDDCSKVVGDVNANNIDGPGSLQNVQGLLILQSCRKCLCDKKLTMCLRGKPCPVEGKNHSDVCPPTSDVQVAEKAENKVNNNTDNESKSKINDNIDNESKNKFENIFNDKAENKSNVGLIEMAKMVATSGFCFTGDLWKNYGCYCGLGSRCTRPVDCLDSCCEQHFKCYGDLEKELHPGEGYVLMLGYNWREEADDIGCDDCSKVVSDINANSIIGPRSLQKVQELHVLQSCRKCLCDKKLTMCLRGKPCPVERENHSDVCPPTADVQVAEIAENKVNNNTNNESKSKINDNKDIKSKNKVENKFNDKAENESNVGLIKMAKMVATSGLCFTGDMWKNYGCYCGLESRCTRPVDCLDSCCEQHHKCYGNLEKELHPDEGYVLMLGYNWRQKADDIGCDDCSNVVGDVNANSIVGLRSLRNIQNLHILQSCRKCLCDKKLTMCLRGKPCPAEGKNHSDVCPPTSDVQVAEKAENKVNKNTDNESKSKVNDNIDNESKNKVENKFNDKAENESANECKKKINNKADNESKKKIEIKFNDKSENKSKNKDMLKKINVTNILKKQHKKVDNKLKGIKSKNKNMKNGNETSVRQFLQKYFSTKDTFNRALEDKTAVGSIELVLGH